MTTAIELIVTDLRGKLNGQLAALESARTRAAVALSISGVAAGLFGPRLPEHPGGWYLAAIIALAVTGLLTLYVLKPRRLTLWPEGEGWRQWATDYQTWTEKYHQPDNSGALLASKMADNMSGWYVQNKDTINRTQWALTLAFLGVAVQLLCWTIPLFLN